MGKTQKLFENVMTFENFKETMEDNVNYLLEGLFNLESLNQAVNGLSTLPDENRRLVLRFMRHVDRKLNFPGAAAGNRFHKIPTIMAGFMYIRYYPEQIKDLSLDELTVLSFYSVVEPPSFYENAVDYLGKDLITAATAKHFNYSYQNMFLDYGESKIRKGESKESAATYIRDTPLETLTKEVVEWEREEIYKEWNFCL